MENKSETRLPNWVVILLCLIVGLIVFFITPKSYSEKQAKQQREIIKNDIDSVSGVRDSVLQETLNKSKTGAVKASALIKTISNEEPIITDTTYTAMCEYITNYK